VETAGKRDLEASRLLERLLLLSAGLDRLRSRTEIANIYAKTTQFRRDYLIIDRSLAGSRGTFEISGRDALFHLVRGYRPADLIIATAHHGHFVAFFSACARAGMRLAACYRSIGAVYRNALQESGVALLDLDTMQNVTQIFDAFDRLRMEGRYLALMIDAPFASRRRYPFLGYDVTVSSMPWLYAKRRGASLLPLAGNLISERLLGYNAGTVLEDLQADRMQDLLKFLQGVILEQPQQYAWTANSFLLSDPTAREAALSFLTEVLDWRGVNYHHRT
jgi:lauroyl/myristoyl acyltransferase